jgi:hypothetical protein
MAMKGFMAASRPLVGLLLSVGCAGVARDGVFDGGGLFVLVAAEDTWFVGFGVRHFATGEQCSERRDEEKRFDSFHKGLLFLILDSATPKAHQHWALHLLAIR